MTTGTGILQSAEKHKRKLQFTSLDGTVLTENRGDETAGVFDILLLEGHVNWFSLLWVRG